MNRLNRLWILCLSAAVFLLSGCAANCNSCRRAQERNRRPLEGNAWVVYQIDGYTIPTAELDTEIRFHATDHTFRCTGRAEGLTGHFAQNEAEVELRFELDAPTDAPRGTLYDKLREVLSHTSAYAMDAGMLLLMEGNRLLAVLQAQDK